MKKILIMGLPGAGKTYLAEKLVTKLNAVWLNADRVREEYNDWDFSPEGRTRQANRMKELDKKLLMMVNTLLLTLCVQHQKQEKTLELIIQYG